MSRRQYCIKILYEVTDGRPRTEVALDHSLSVLLKSTAVGMTSGKRQRDLCGVGTARSREQEALRHTGNIAGDHDLVSELGDLTASSWANVAGPAHRLPNTVVPCAIKITPLTTGHDR